MAKKGSKKEAADEGESLPVVPPRMMEKYEQEVLPAMKKSMGRENRLALPRLEKIVLNMGVGEATQDKKFL